MGCLLTSWTAVKSSFPPKQPFYHFNHFRYQDFVLFLGFFVVEIIFQHFENLIQTFYQYTACEQVLLCECRENFAHLLCFYWLVSWHPESWEIQKSTGPVQAHFSLLNWHKRVLLANRFIYGGVSQWLIYLDILVRFFLIIYPHQ